MAAPAGRASVRLAILAEGTRGDVQPYIALALHLQQRGHPIEVFTNVDHVVLCEGFGLKANGVLFNCQVAQEHPDVQAAMASGSAFQVARALVDMHMRPLRSDLKSLWPALEAFQPSAVLYGSLSRAKALMWSFEKQVPAISVELQVTLPVSDVAPAGLPTLPCGLNKLWHALFLRGGASELPRIHTVAKAVVGADFSDRLTMDYLSKFFYDIPNLPVPMFYGVSPSVIPIHPEWPTSNFHLCGFFTLDPARQAEAPAPGDADRALGGETHDALRTFLAEGPPPVCMGWGSMTCQSAQHMAKLAVGALKHAGARGVILGGWAKLGLEHVPEGDLKDYCKDHVRFVQAAPHEWLFPQCSCVVHHGGCGTTAASLRAGRPTVITPVMGDQYDFAASVNRMHCGVGLSQLSSVTARDLGEALTACLEDEVLKANAARAGEQLRAEDGCENFARLFDEWWSAEVPTGRWLRRQAALLEELGAAASAPCCGVQ